MISFKKPTKLCMLYIVLIIFVACLSIMIWSLCATSSPKSSFVPPPFEDHAISGEPTVPSELSYGTIAGEEIPYSLCVCATLGTEGDQLIVYFTNPSVNAAWLRLRVLDENGDVIAQSGILKPGQYITDLPLERLPSNGEKIQLKVMGYEAETYQSIGSVVLNHVISYQK